MYIQVERSRGEGFEEYTFTLIADTALGHNWKQREGHIRIYSAPIGGLKEALGPVPCSVASDSPLALLTLPYEPGHTVKIRVRDRAQLLLYCRLWGPKKMVCNLEQVKYLICDIGR